MRDRFKKVIKKKLMIILHSQSCNNMQLFFATLSLASISGIFLLADSPMLAKLSSLNPYSLLHIPLYGVLSILLLFSITPNKTIRTQQINRRNHFLVAGLIALGVAIADEYHQSFISGRTASINDVVLDLIGIVSCLFLFSRIRNLLSQQTLVR